MVYVSEVLDRREINIFALLPSYNEEENVGEVIKGLREKGINVLVVDDGSQDSTSQIARKEGALVLRNERNLGKGAALRRGFEFLKNKDFDVLLILDADGQHSPKEVDKFLEEFINKGFDLIIGNRFHSSPKGMPLIRYFTNKVMSFIISILAKKKIKDSQCGFRLMSKRFLKELDLETTHFEVESEMIFQAILKGFNISEVSIESIYKKEKSKINPFLDTLRFFRLLFRYIPRLCRVNLKKN